MKMIAEPDQLGVIISIATFLGGLLLTSDNNQRENGICINIKCEIIDLIRITAGMLWLLLLSISTYLYLTKIKEDRIHKINILCLIISMIMTIVFIISQAIIMINQNNILNGSGIIINTGIFIIIFLSLIYHPYRFNPLDLCYAVLLANLSVVKPRHNDKIIEIR